VPDLHARPLLDAPLVRAAAVACSAPRSAPGAAERSAATELVLPRRGVFVVHRNGGPVVADPATAVVLREGEEYRVSHPVEHGDRCTALAFAPGIVEEALPRATHVVFGPARSCGRRSSPRGSTSRGRRAYCCCSPTSPRTLATASA
jgi:hypothetical protein